ncbi:MAG: sn-glycerol-1-phosphate dehydrogenase, partial [Clostridia bacterium]|nr:sn-glycerol-1-phosphate dehydrogenase [Clostridia bacterium]
MDLIFEKNKLCECGKIHTDDIKAIISGKGAIEKLPEELKKLFSKYVYIIADKNTYAVAGERTKALLSENGINSKEFIFENDTVEPDEYSVGAALMNFDTKCDTVLAIGSGVIGDISKIIASSTKLPYAIVATAPSMDGYASATSSMVRAGLKVTLPSKCPDVIIGDTDILKTAPDKMLISGLGDMLAKYISIAEWRIANIIIGEYYCERIAENVRSALKACVDNAEGLLKREDAAIEAVFSGLVLAGVSMSHAGASRPASGIEHYFSHVWDMRGLEFNTGVSTHGIQCAVSTLISARLYEKLKTIIPDKEKALKFSAEFDKKKWFKTLKEFLGKSADAMILLDKKENKYCRKKQKPRINKI